MPDHYGGHEPKRREIPTPDIRYNAKHAMTQAEMDRIKEGILAMAAEVEDGQGPNAANADLDGGGETEGPVEQSGS